MKTNLTFIWLVLFFITSMNASAQGQTNFQNLNFEAANIPPGSQPDSFIAVTNALPGWTASFTSSTNGTTIATIVNYDSVSLGGETISINDSNTGYGFGPISGKYSVYLFSGNEGSTLYTPSISQAGFVPFGTESLQFQVGIATSPFIVTLDGEIINIAPLATFSTYTLYGGDVSAFAGLNETLTFTETFPTTFAPPGIFSLDNIIFSTSPVPEPGTCGLILCGAVLFGLKHWRQRPIKRVKIKM
jgi:hypothetical protein